MHKTASLEVSEVRVGSLALCDVTNFAPPSLSIELSLKMTYFRERAHAEQVCERKRRKYVKTSGVYRGFLIAGDAGVCDSPTKVQTDKIAVAIFLSSPTAWVRKHGVAAGLQGAAAVNQAHARLVGNTHKKSDADGASICVVCDDTKEKENVSPIAPKDILHCGG